MVSHLDVCAPRQCGPCCYSSTRLKHRLSSKTITPVAKEQNGDRHKRPAKLDGGIEMARCGKAKSRLSDTHRRQPVKGREGWEVLVASMWHVAHSVAVLALPNPILLDGEVYGDRCYSVLPASTWV